MMYQMHFIHKDPLVLCWEIGNSERAFFQPENGAGKQSKGILSKSSQI